MSGMPVVLFALMMLMFTAGHCRGEAKGEVRIIADSLTREQSSATYRAAGDVRIYWQDYSLFADTVDYSEAEQTARAAGSVRLLRGDDELTGDAVRIRVDTSEGEVKNGRLRTREGNLRVKGALLEKLGDDRFRVKGGSFTTCDADPPSWKFTASDLDLTLEGFASGRNVVFSIADIPVFYTPYLLFPAKRERQSGLLFPRLGSSTKKGFFFDLPYYWAVSPSAEAIFDLDIQARRGVGVGSNASWLGSRGSHGGLNLYTIYDWNLSRLRSQGSARVKQVMTSSADLNTDMLFASDRSFFRDFGEASGDYNRQALDSSISVTDRRGSWYLAAETRLLNELDGADNRRTLQRLPELTVIGSGFRLGTLPVHAGVGGRLTNFYRREGERGIRLILQPTVSYDTGLRNGVSLSGWGGYQQRFYSAYGSTGDVDDNGIGIAMAGARVSSRFDRIFDTGGEHLTRLRHLLEPSLGYSYIQQKEQSQLPFFDYDDRVIGQSLASWALASSLTGRFEQAGVVEFRELILLRLSQGYQISGGRRDLLNPGDAGRSLTDLRLEARLQPFAATSLETDSYFSTYSGEVTSAAVSGSLHDLKGNEAGIGFRRLAGSLDYLEGKLSLSLVKPMVFQYTGRYSLDRSGFLEQYYAVEYRHQCWSVTLSYRDRPDNREFLVGFNLAGIGGLGKVKLF